MTRSFDGTKHLYYLMDFRRVTKAGSVAWTPEDGKVCIHPSSVNDKVNNFPSPYITYFTKQQSTSVYLHDTTCVTAPVLVFAAPNMSISTRDLRVLLSA